MELLPAIYYKMDGKLVVNDYSSKSLSKRTPYKGKYVSHFFTNKVRINRIFTNSFRLVLNALALFSFKIAYAWFEYYCVLLSAFIRRNSFLGGIADIVVYKYKANMGTQKPKVIDLHSLSALFDSFK